MQMFVSKNNQQIGPLEATQVLAMLNRGELVAGDLGYVQGGTQWLPLGSIFQAPAQPPIGIADWAKRNLPMPISVANASAGTAVAMIFGTIFVLGVLPMLIGIIGGHLLHTEGMFGITLLGGLMLVILTPFLMLALLIRYFSARRNVAEFNQSGLKTIGGREYEWKDLRHVDFVKARSTAVGSGLLLRLVTQMIWKLVWRAMIADDRAVKLQYITLVFANGRATVPSAIGNFPTVCELLERIPAKKLYEGSTELKDLVSFGFRFEAGRDLTPNAAPTPVQSSKLAFASALASVVLVLGGLLVFGVTYAVFGSPQNRNGRDIADAQRSSNSSTSPTTSKSPDIRISSDDFKKDELLSLDEMRRKYENKIVEIKGRIYKFGSYTSLRTIDSQVVINFSPSDASKGNQLTDDERVTVNCGTKIGIGMDLVNCILVDKQPAISPDEPADYSLSAQDYYNEVENYRVSSTTRDKNRKKYSGKVLELTGNVKSIGSAKTYLQVGKDDWVTCYPDEGNTASFEKLSEGQEVKFRAFFYNSGLRHCIVVQ